MRLLLMVVAGLTSELQAPTDAEEMITLHRSRSVDASIRAAIEEGYRRSSVFAELVQDVERSNFIVDVDAVPTFRNGMKGAVLLAPDRQSAASTAMPSYLGVEAMAVAPTAGDATRGPLASIFLDATTSTGSESPDEASASGARSVQDAALQSDVPASCHVNEMDARRSRLKLLDETTYELARAGCRGSATFQGLVRRIEELQGFVYITSMVKLPATAEGALLHRIQETPDGSRCLWIVVKRDRLSAYRVGVLGHELQHAVEVLEDPDVRSPDDLERFLRRQHPANDGQVFETDAALSAGDRVVSELAKRNRRQ